MYPHGLEENYPKGKWDDNIPEGHIWCFCDTIPEEKHWIRGIKGFRISFPKLTTRELEYKTCEAHAKSVPKFSSCTVKWWKLSIGEHM